MIQEDLQPPKNDVNNMLYVKSYLKLFFETSSIHGFRHLVALRRQLPEILLWLMMLCFSAYGSFYLSNLTWSRYQLSPTVISMDRDMFAWNTTFPSVTICPDNIEFIDKKRLDLYLSNSDEENKTELQNFIRGLVNASYKSFKYVPKYSKINADNYIDLVLNLTREFEPDLNIGIKNATLHITPTITEMGLCYGVNSKAAVYNSPNYRATDRWDAINNEVQSLFTHPLDGQIFAQLLNMNTSYKVYLHGPEEIPDISSKFLYSPNGFFMKMYVSALSIYTSEEAAELSISQRRCRFPHENNLKHNSVYSYTLCKMECRIELSLKYCQCIPHFYRRIGDEKICDVEKFECLAKHKDELYTLKTKDGKKIDCSCLPLCDDVYYIVQTNGIQKWILGTNLQWGIVSYPRMRYRRDIIFGFTDVLVAVGGMAGLFLGCSVLSFVEIIYFATLRLLCYSYKRYAIN